MEYAFGGDPRAPSPAAIPVGELISVEGLEGGGESMAINFRRRLGADEARVTVESSGVLSTWSNTGVVPELVRVINNGDGTETLSYRIDRPVSSTRGFFLRARVFLSQ